MCDKVKSDLDSEFEIGNYKSCFAQSMVIDSQCKQSKSSNCKQFDPRNGNTSDNSGREARKELSANRSTSEIQEILRLRKNTRSMFGDTRRYSCGNMNSSRRTSLCSSKVSDTPIENMYHQSKIDTLQWQLKEVRKSREMYKAVMKQVVTFLGKAHQSLELLSTRMATRRTSTDDSWGMDKTNIPRSTNATLDEHEKRDLQWRQSKPEGASPEEIPPDKLSSEAFRLWRMTQSLLNIQESDLAPVDPADRLEDDFLAQLAREFPPQPEVKPQRATSFNVNPKGIGGDVEGKVSTAFNRKLSLQVGEARRISKNFRKIDSTRGSVAESDSDTQCGQKNKREKSNSPPSGSESSVEDESGFSSMNSFQEVGLPLINSTMTEEVSTKNALLRSMLHKNEYSSLNFSIGQHETLVVDDNIEKRDRKPHSRRGNVDEIRLWQKPTSSSSSGSSATAQHQRWYSTPVEETVASQSVKVLWV